jgi:hypothetical protein
VDDAARVLLDAEGAADLPWVDCELHRYLRPDVAATAAAARWRSAVRVAFWRAAHPRARSFAAASSFGSWT